MSPNTQLKSWNNPNGSGNGPFNEGMVRHGFTLFSVSVNGFRSTIESTMKKSRASFLKNVVSVSQTALRIFGTSTNVRHSAEQSELAGAATQVLRKWAITGIDWPIETQEQMICKTWHERARFSLQVSNPNLDSERLLYIIKLYWRANHAKPNLSFRCFLSKLRKILQKSECMPVRYVNHESLISLLVGRFALQIEIFSNLLCKSVLIKDWLSHDPDDRTFGAETGPEEDILPGRNSCIKVWWGNDFRSISGRYAFSPAH